MLERLTFALASAVLGTSSLALAEDATPETADAVEAEAPATPPAHDRDDSSTNLYLRLAGGPGYSHARTQTDVGIDAFSGLLDVNCGVELAPGFAAHGTFWLGGAFSASTTETETTVTTEGADVLFGTLGAGVTYTFPLRIFLSVAAGVSAANASEWELVSTDDSFTATSGSREWANPGFGFRTNGGKEWPLNDKWSIGFNVTYAFMTYGDKDTPNRLTVDQIHYFGPSFSATFQL